MAGDTTRLQAGAGPLARHVGPLPLHTFLRLVDEQWQDLRLGERRLKARELEVLACRAGFAGGLHPHQPPLAPGAVASFAAWFGGQLEVIAAVQASYACVSAQLVAGFDVGRLEAVDCLRLHSPGTFCLRLGSLAGHLVLSLVEPGSGGVPASPPCISHFLLSAARLRMTGLPRALQQVPGCLRLLDLSTGERHRPSIVRKAVERWVLPPGPPPRLGLDPAGAPSGRHH